MAGSKLLVYILRRDLRVADNPIFHHLATSKDHGYTHLLPLFVFPAHQNEVSGFLKDGEKSPYPQALSQVGGFWRCGPHRSRFLAQSVWDVKETLENIDSGLVVRVGSIKDNLSHLIASLKEQGPSVGGVWMTEEVSWEESQEHEAVASVCSDSGIDFKLWPDEKYFVDDRDTGLEKPSELADVFTSYRKSQEPLRERPRSPLPRPGKSELPAFPEASSIPPQQSPFVEAANYQDLEKRLLQPLGDLLTTPPPMPSNAVSAHPFSGGETRGWKRLDHLIKSGSMATYKETRNGLIGEDFSTKLSAYLALGCLSARQVHKELVDFEDGKNSAYESGKGYGKGENDGTRGVRFELLWRDYMRLCTKKFGRRLFDLSGFKHDVSYNQKWKTADKSSAPRDQSPSPEEVKKITQRFLEGTTGMGLIDAAQRELFHTGYTSNRTRQNVASFFSKHLGIDWRYGAEWYEMLLIDYDVSSNWSNWQYVAGVGNDPRGDARIFNPVKQAFDYDKDGSYVRMWVPEVKDLENLENVFQPCTASREDLQKCGLEDNIMVMSPVKRIEFSVDKKPKTPRKPFNRRRGQGRGGRRGGGNGGGGGHGNGNGNGNHGNNGVNGHGSSANGHSSSGSNHDGQGGGGQHHNGNQHHGQSNHQSHHQYMAMDQGYNNMNFKGMKNYNNNGGYQGYQGYAHAAGGGGGGQYPPQQFGDAQWFNNAWDPNYGRGRGYGNGRGHYGNGNGNSNGNMNGGYRGRGGRRGGGGGGGGHDFYNGYRGGYGGPPQGYMGYNQMPMPYYHPHQNMGPTV